MSLLMKRPTLQKLMSDFAPKTFYNIDPSGLYYKNIIIVIDASGVVSE
jgi:hypothetical protein